MGKKSIQFSPQVATIVIVSNKAIDRSVKKSIGISSTDYCILQQLSVYNAKVMSTIFQEFLLLKPNSVSSAVARLEEKGYVKKELNKEDLRTFNVWITPKGKEASKKASSIIREELGKISWEDPYDERINWGMQVHASLFYKDKSNFKNVEPETNFLSIDLEDEYFVVPGWVNGIKLLQQLWNTTLSRNFQISLSEYRIIAYLTEERGDVFSGDLAEELFLDKSAISAFIKTLMARGLVDLKVSQADKRCFNVLISPKGASLESAVTELLSKITAEHFDSLPQEVIDRQNQWHLDMYDALRRSTSRSSAPKT